MIRVVADDKIPFLKGVLEPFALITYLPAKMIGRDAIQYADALLIRTRTRCDEKLLHNTAVKFIATATIGFDHIDTEYCKKAGIHWINAPGCNASSVMQYIAAALFSISVKGKFLLDSKTIGIVGVGNVGSKVEKLARLLGMRVLLNDPPRERIEGPGKFVSLETALKESDIITLHVPLTKEGNDRTFHLIGGETLSRMKKCTWLINSSRGEVVQTHAIKVALTEEKLSGAVLDVWENEPNPDPGLLALTFIATPHIAGYSLDGKANGTAMIVRALAEHFSLPLSDWYPSGLAVPENPEIRIDVKNWTAEEIICEAVLRTYPILSDDARFRRDFASFESQRENYPVRREFPAYRVHLSHPDPAISDKLMDLGFQMI